MSSIQLDTVRNSVLQLLSVIRPNAVALVDAFDFPDALLCSVLGRYDGQVYDNLYNWAADSPLNKTSVSNNSIGSMTANVSIVYYYNGAQRYEQFLQVGQLYRTLILLSLALFRAFLCLHGAIYVLKKILRTSFFLSASLYVSKRGAYWDRLCRDVIGRWLVGCHARALWPNGAS